MRFLYDIKMVLTLTCEKSSRLLSDDLERPLTTVERTALRLHLLLCRSCRRFRRNIRFLRDLMHHAHHLPEVSGPHLSSLTTDERHRLVEAIRRAQEENL